MRGGAEQGIMLDELQAALKLSARGKKPAQSYQNLERRLVGPLRRC